MSEQQREQLHPSMQFLPAGEIDRRIGQASADTRNDFRESMKNIEDKVDHMSEQITLLVGTPETKGVLSRIEDSLALVADNQAAFSRTHQERVIADDEFRAKTLQELSAVKRDVETLKKEVAIFKTVIAISSAVLRGAKRISDSTWTMKIILAIVAYLASVYSAHTVWPMIRESIKHHRVMF